jgi:hypothetical protein
VEKNDYFDLDIAAAAIPIGMMMSIHNQFMDESDVAGAVAAGAVAAGAVGTVTFCLSESTLTPVTDGSVGAVTPFITLFSPETPKDGKVTPMRTFCLKVDGGLPIMGPGVPGPSGPV